MGIKRALLVGINTYPSAPLRGCVNDVLAMEELLSNLYGFQDIKMLTDNEATTDNMRRELNDLVAGLIPGDTIYFHYSGHGSQVYDSTQDEIDGLDEIICPVDLNWRDKMITDDELKSIFDRVPDGVNLTVTLDCCNSGGGMDHDNQYQSLGEADRNVQKEGRFLPPPPEELVPQIEQLIGFKPRALSRDINATSLMISGCQAHQTSADAYIEGRYMGACTYFLAKNLRISPKTNYKTLVDNMNNNLASVGFTQRPELNGPASLFDMKFLDPIVIGTGLETPDSEVEIPVVEDTVDAPEPKKDKNKLMIGIAIAAAAALAYFVLG